MAIKAGKWEMSDEEFERQYAEATRRGKERKKQGAYAIAARCDGRAWSARPCSEHDGPRTRRSPTAARDASPDHSCLRPWGLR